MTWVAVLPNKLVNTDALRRPAASPRPLAGRGLHAR